MIVSASAVSHRRSVILSVPRGRPSQRPPKSFDYFKGTASPYFKQGATIAEVEGKRRSGTRQRRDPGTESGPESAIYSAAFALEKREAGLTVHLSNTENQIVEAQAFDELIHFKELPDPVPDEAE